MSLVVLGLWLVIIMMKFGNEFGVYLIEEFVLEIVFMSFLYLVIFSFGNVVFIFFVLWIMLYVMIFEDGLVILIILR